MIITVLVENTETEGLCAEHGLCLYVQYRGKSYLIDSGTGTALTVNADRLGVDLGRVDGAFLSHAHYDHGGGYPAFFQRNGRAKVVLQKASGNRDCLKIAGPVRKYIGLPKDLLTEYQDRFEFVDGAADLGGGIHIVPHSSDGLLARAERTHMCVEIGGRTEFDDFSHEQTVVFEEEDGLVCFNSCSHSGVDVAVDEVQRAFPGRRIKAYVGGFHMMGADGVSTCAYPKEEVQQVARRLLETSDATFWSGHCTGTIAYSWLKEVMRDRLEALTPGRVIEL